MKKETTFIINYDENIIEFNDGTVCNIDYDTDSFEYRGYSFTMQSDVEKDLEFIFNERFVDMTVRE